MRNAGAESSAERWAHPPGGATQPQAASRGLRRAICAFGLAALILLSGCIQLETRVKLNEDGSAIVTERIRFTRRLLERSGDEGGQFDIAGLLTREAAQERAKRLGEGVEVVRHEARRVTKGGREAVIVYRAADINKLRYANPFIRHPDYRNGTEVGFEIDVVKRGSYLGDVPGELRLRIMPTSVKEGTVTAVEEKARKHPRTAPARLQQLRRLQPVIRDLVRDLKVKFTFESYAPVRCSFAMRGFELEGTIKEVDLLDIDHRNLDRRGANFFANEEALLDLMRWRLDSPTIRAELKNANVNKTLPILMSRAGAIWFKPSRALYDRHVKNVKLDFGAEGGLRTVGFDEVGYRSLYKEQPKDKTTP